MVKKQDDFLIDDSFDMDGEDEEDMDLLFDDNEDTDSEFEYDMDGEDDDEEDMEFIDGNETPDSLDELVIKLSTLVDEYNFDASQLRQIVFEEALGSLAKERGVDLYDLILCSSTEDVGYNQMISGLYPAIAKHLSQVINEKNRPLLIELLHQAITEVLNRGKEDLKPINSLLSEDDDEEDPEVEFNTMRVMSIYKDLFEVGFELKIPYGVLTKEGRLRINKNNQTVLKPSSSLSSLYNLINDITGGFLVQSELDSSTHATNLRELNLRKGTNYYPEFQLGNLFGVLGNKKVDSWSDLKTILQQEVRSNIKQNLEAGKDITQIVDALTTCIVISEFDPKVALSLRINVGNGLLNKQLFEREYNNRKQTLMAGTGDLFHCQLLPSGVLEVVLVFSKAAYNGRPLFAYEAVQNLNARGKKPSLKQMILGQDTSGKILTTNLDSQQACIILIGAGQRSGKGVLTLNLLGTILAEGSPLIYLDGKPDMAPVLWNVGKKYGVNPAAWDLFESNGNIEGQGAPESMLVENPGIFGLLMYFKAVQLMMVAASLQAKDIKILDGKRPFFIFDEAFAVQMQMSSVWGKVLNIAKDKSADPNERAWCEAIVRWAESLDSDLPAIINSQLPKSGVSTIWLFQSMQPTSWNSFQVQGLSAGSKINIMKKPIESRLSIKFLGRGTSDSEYALGSAKVKENPLVANRVLSDGGRHFAMSGSQKITSMDAVTVFKPYLVLNESENGTKAAEELKGNLSSDILSVVAPNGELHPGVGFEGFAKMIGDDAIHNLSQGRAYLEAILDLTGLMSNYSSIDEYLYDASAESFKTLGELVRKASGEVDVDETPYDTSTFDFNNQQNKDNSNINDMVVDDTDDTNGVDFDHMPNEEFGSPHYKTGLNISEDTDNSQEQWGTQRQQDIPFTQKDMEHIQQTYNQGQQSKPKPTYESPNQQLHYDNLYTEQIQIDHNPFIKGSRSEGTISALNSIRMMSNYIMQDILRVFGDYSRIESIEVTGTGLVVNNIAYRPQFSQEVIESMPYDIKIQVMRGNILELFHFENLNRFRNLGVLRIDNPRLAEGRVRREIGLHPRKDWNVLFKKFPYLREIIIAGEVITDQDSAQSYNERGKKGYELQEKLREKLKLPTSRISNSVMEKVWHSAPVKITSGALGLTLGVKAVGIAATIFGGWGLLFGAFAGYGAYREIKKRNSR